MKPVCVLGALAVFAAGGAFAESMTEIAVIGDLSDASGWGAVGRATVTPFRDREGTAGLELTFGGAGEAGYGVVQGPVESAAEAWPEAGEQMPNAMVARVRCARQVMLTLNLRVRRRGVPGLPGVVGVCRASSRVAPGVWQDVVFPFSSFQSPSAELAVNGALFTTYHPQIQFTMGLPPPNAAPIIAVVDRLSFAYLDGEAVRRWRQHQERVDLHWQGRDMGAAVIGAVADACPTGTPDWQASSAPGLTGPPAPRARRRASLPLWTFVPVLEDEERLGAPAAVDLPHGFPGRREYRAGWYVRRVDLNPVPDGRVVLCFDAVALFAEVTVNGRVCGEHLGSYTPFEVDVTEACRPGTNTVAVYVHDAANAIVTGRALNQVGVWRPDVRRRPAGGIQGDVWLEHRPGLYVADVWVRTRVAERVLDLVFEVCNRTGATASFSVHADVVTWPEGNAVGVAGQTPTLTLAAGQVETLSLVVPWDDPHLWTPDDPYLYVLRTTVRGDADLETVATRFGFRDFRTDGRRFLLNGVPLRLLGESHYRYGHSRASKDPETGRDFNREMMALLKRSFGINALRLHASIAPRNAVLGADEAGILLINQSSIWSAMGRHYQRGGDLFLEHTEAEFREWVRRDRNSPSVAIWDVENEMIRGGRENMPWVMKLDGFVRRHDPTRPIEHSGAGWYDDSQDIVHLHMQEHYSGVLEYWQERGRRPLVMGEFWVGGRGETRLTSADEFADRTAWFEAETGIYADYIMEMRRAGCSGVMPFLVSASLLVPPGDGRPFLSCEPGGPIAAALRSESMARRIRHCLQPITAFFWPRGTAGAAGGVLQREIVVCNDSVGDQILELRWGVGPDLGAHHTVVTLAPGAQQKVPVTLSCPSEPAKMQLRLEADGVEVCSDVLAVEPVVVHDLDGPVGTSRFCLYGAGAWEACTASLRTHGVEVSMVDTVPDDPAGTVFIIAPGGSDRRLDAMRPHMLAFLRGGGRVLCLAQDHWPRWTPVRLGFWPSIRAVPPAYAETGWPDDSRDLYFSRYAPIYAPGHPLFAGISGARLSWWSPRDGRVSDDALVRPSAVATLAPGSWRVLAGASRRENAAVVEVREGHGTALFCQARVVACAGHPQAQALLRNAVSYLAGGGWVPMAAAAALSGSLSPADAARSSGLPASAFELEEVGSGALMIAVDGADLGAMAQWARAGGCVLVLSAEAAGRIPGCEVGHDPGLIYAGVRTGVPHPLFAGVSTGSFTGFDAPCVNGVLRSIPDRAAVILGGLAGDADVVRYNVTNLRPRGITCMDGSDPVAVRLAVGRGEWLITTMEPWRLRTEQDAELWSLLLANAGLAVPNVRTRRTVRVLRTVPLRLDGRLDDWTNDIEDRNVSPFVHAAPMPLTSADVVAGTVVDDSEFSGIAYLLWDDANLYIATAVFGTVEDPELQVWIGSSRVSIHPGGNDAPAVTVNGTAAERVRAAADTVQAGDLVDSRLLVFTRVDPRVGNLLPVEHVRGRTAEVALPWGAVGGRPAAGSPLLVRLCTGDGRMLQMPVDAQPSAPETWANMQLAAE